MLRLGAVAKMFGVRPSDYLPELSSYEKFCVDEAIAYVLSKEQKRIMDEHTSKRGRQGLCDNESEQDPLYKNKPTPQQSAWDILTHKTYMKDDDETIDKRGEG